MEDKRFIKSIIAGILIGVSDYIYLNTANKVVASFIFPLALITIISTNLNLYTGRIGRVNSSNWASMLNILLGNALGIFLLSLLIPYNANYQLLIDTKLLLSYREVFAKAFICGILMYLAVSYTNGGKNFLLTILCVAGFLVSGCEHSIADIGYVFMCREFTIPALEFILLVTMGNTFGSVLIHRLIDYINH